MLGDVLAALGAVPGLDGVIVVTASRARRRRRARRGARWSTIPPRPASRPPPCCGVEAALARAAERVLLVPGDCPALEPAEVAGLLDGFPKRRTC